MLSRTAALASRRGLLAARLSARTSASPAILARPAIVSLAGLSRTYAKNNRPGRFSPNNPGNNSSQPRPSQADTSRSSNASQSSSQPPKQDSSNAPVKPPNSEGAGISDKQQSSEAAKEDGPIPFDKLPDLTQGIPSTLEAEMEEREQKPSSALEAVSRERRRERSDRDDDPFMTSVDRSRRWWARFMLIGSATGAVVGILYLGRGWDDEIEAMRHQDIPNGWSPALWWQRVRSRFGESVAYYQDPAFEKLLPDPDPTFSRPYTLCLSLDDLLVHSEWTREHGWRVAKRPGFDYFIRYLSQYYELVLFTSAPFGTAEPLIRKLDPYHFIIWPLFREATKFEDGEIVKDLSYLNRDLSKVIIIDTKSEHVRKQPENAIVLKPWTGDPKDSDLVGLIPFLEFVYTMEYSDVRKILKSFEGKHIPSEFARREAIARKEYNARLAQKAKHTKPSGFGALGNALGLKPSNMSMTVAADGEQSPSEAFAQGKMLQDIARERGQRNYELLEQQIRENGEKWLKEEQVILEKAQQEAMGNMMSGFSGWFTPKPSDPPSSDANPPNKP